jgi:hypothetical protein
MSTLVITVNGPFAYVCNFPQRGFLTLMAPMCPQHLGGISSIESENQYAFEEYNHRNHKANLGGCAAHLYELKINPGNAPYATPSGNLLTCLAPKNGFDPREWRFWLKLPTPNIVVPVDPVHALIITPGVQLNVPPPYAVGARLVYTDWDFAPIPLLYCDHDPPSGPRSFTLCDYGDHHASLDIQYSGPLRDDPGHEDAVNCFETLMNTLELPWSIYFDPKGDLSLLSSRLTDCQAAIAWIG